MMNAQWSLRRLFLYGVTATLTIAGAVVANHAGEPLGCVAYPLPLGCGLVLVKQQRPEAEQLRAIVCSRAT